MSGPATGTRHLTRPSPRLHQTRTAARVRAPAGTLRGVQDALQPALGAGCPAAHKTPFHTSHLGPVNARGCWGRTGAFGRRGSPRPRQAGGHLVTPAACRLAHG